MVQYSKIICLNFSKIEERHECTYRRFMLSSMQKKTKPDFHPDPLWCRGQASTTKGTPQTTVKDQNERLSLASVISGDSAIILRKKQRQFQT